jgi:hypothetical protein
MSAYQPINEYSNVPVKRKDSKAGTRKSMGDSHWSAHY